MKYKNKREAEIVHNALKPDNYNFVESSVIDNKILFKIKNNSVRSALATADDLIAAEIIAEKILKIIGD